MQYLKLKSSGPIFPVESNLTIRVHISLSGQIHPPQQASILRAFFKVKCSHYGIWLDCFHQWDPISQHRTFCLLPHGCTSPSSCSVEKYTQNTSWCSSISFPVKISVLVATFFICHGFMGSVTGAAYKFLIPTSTRPTWKMVALGFAASSSALVGRNL